MSPFPFSFFVLIAAAEVQKIENVGVKASTFIYKNMYLWVYVEHLLRNLMCKWMHKHKIRRYAFSSGNEGTDTI